MCPTTSSHSLQKRRFCGLTKSCAGTLYLQPLQRLFSVPAHNCCCPIWDFRIMWFEFRQRHFSSFILLPWSLPNRSDSRKSVAAMLDLYAKNLKPWQPHYSVWSLHCMNDHICFSDAVVASRHYPLACTEIPQNKIAETLVFCFMTHSSVRHIAFAKYSRHTATVRAQ